MSKALIEKAFEKVWQTFPNRSEHPNYEHLKELCKYFWETCATWQREQLEAEIREAFTDGCRQGHDEASESIFNAETRVREQLIQEIKPLIYKAYCEYGCSGVTSKPNNSCDAGEMKSCGGCYTWKTYQSILAKLDLLEKGE